MVSQPAVQGYQKTYPIPIVHCPLEHLDLPIRILLQHILHLVLLVHLEIGVFAQDLLVEGCRCFVCRGDCFLQLKIRQRCIMTKRGMAERHRQPLFIRLYRKEARGVNAPR